MGNVWKQFFNLIFQNGAIIEFNFDVQQSLRALRGQPLHKKSIIKFIE